MGSSRPHGDRRSAPHPCRADQTILRANCAPTQGSASLSSLKKLTGNGDLSDGRMNPAKVESGMYDDRGYPLWVVYGVWVLVVAALYFPCRWYARYRARHKENWWLSYL